MLTCKIGKVAVLYTRYSVLLQRRCLLWQVLYNLCIILNYRWVYFTWQICYRIFAVYQICCKTITHTHLENLSSTVFARFIGLYSSNFHWDNIVLFILLCTGAIHCSHWLLRHKMAATLHTGCNILTFDNARLQQCSWVWWNALDSYSVESC